MNLLASNLLSVRQARGFTQSYVAAQCGMSQPNYSDIERGKTEPSVNQILRLAEVLETTVSDLLMEECAATVAGGKSRIQPQHLSDSDKDRYIKILEGRVRVLLARK